jgi:hypothetical protein
VRSGTRGCGRPVGLARVAALWIAAGFATAQGPADHDASRVFAMPWEITPSRIQQAMRSTDYELWQVRRFASLQDHRGGRPWIALQEHLAHAGTTVDEPEQFSLEFVGLEDRELQPGQHDQLAQWVADRVGYLFHYQSFAVADPELMAQNYEISVLGFGSRLDRPVYRVAVTSRDKNRPSWMLELDVWSGYPLYRAEFGPTGERLSELEVTRFELVRPTIEQERRRFTEQRLDSAEAALHLAGLPLFGIPDAASLPAGYAFHSAKLITSLLNAEKRVVLQYTDGVDSLFLQIFPGGKSPVAGHVIHRYSDETGTAAQIWFVHRNVSYLLIGRNANNDLLELAKSLYGRVVKATG